MLREMPDFMTETGTTQDELALFYDTRKYGNFVPSSTKRISTGQNWSNLSNKTKVIIQRIK